MSIKSFNDLLEQIKEEFMSDENSIRYCILPEEKLSRFFCSNRELSYPKSRACFQFHQ